MQLVGWNRTNAQMEMLFGIDFAQNCYRNRKRNRKRKRIDYEIR